MSFDDSKLYVVTGDFLNNLKKIETRLYHHDFKRINADESRDMANFLNCRLLAEPFELEIENREGRD